MTYTRPWNEAWPAGSDDASLADDAIRYLKVDLRERLAAIPGVDLTADPIYTVPDDYQHFSAGFGSAGASNPQPLIGGSGQYMYPGDITGVFRQQHTIKFIEGKTINTVTFYLNRVNASATIVLTVYKVDVATGTYTAFTNVVVTSTGYSAEVQSVSQVMAAGYFYVASIVCTADGTTADTARYYGIKVTYA